ncbi:hypothetical protein HanRHA438_Chr12g0544481 [Helianthus annuus]|nr:hypothetical protein HanRHA438_Chr12g0544481 [Helianthus annuus]
MFTPNFRRCPLSLKLTRFVLNVSKSCTIRPLSLTQFIFFVNSGHPGVFLSFYSFDYTILINKRKEN